MEYKGGAEQVTRHLKPNGITLHTHTCVAVVIGTYKHLI